MKKKYNLKDCEVTVLFEQKIIHIMSSEHLLNHLKANLDELTLAFVKEIKADYLSYFGKPLAITDSSLMVEIWGHLYASKFADVLQELLKMKIIENLSEFVKKRSDTIDCGEADVDANRKFWDVLSNFNSLIIKFL